MFSSRMFDLLDDNYGSYDPFMHMGLPCHRQDIASQSRSNSKFLAMLNVKQFRPDEIDVKTVKNFVVIHGKHEEQADEHGFVSREFTRRYQLPDDVEPEKVKSSLSKNGVLTIEAPRKVPEPLPNEIIIPIEIQRPNLFGDRYAQYMDNKEYKEIETPATLKESVKPVEDGQNK